MYTLVNSAGYAADLPGDPTPIFVIDLKVKMPKFDEFSVRPLSGGAKSVYADVITDFPSTSIGGLANLDLTERPYFV